MAEYRLEAYLELFYFNILLVDRMLPNKLK